MTHSLKALITASLLLLASSSSLAFAEGHPDITKEAFMDRMEQRFDRMDTNGNGVLEADEKPSRHHGGEGSKGHSCQHHKEGDGSCPHHRGDKTTPSAT